MALLARSLRHGITSLRPDQTSVTAQTLTSTSEGRATARMTSSVMSVGTFEARLGQEIQIAPAGLMAARRIMSPSRRSASAVKKPWITSNTGPAAARSAADGPAAPAEIGGPGEDSISGGSPMKATLGRPSTPASWEAGAE